ncbi:MULTISPECIES: ROK family protein [Microbacterium]|uniref:Sugar kinase n=1 Tax=Microbacterium hominis TaxID=162426 RepID=A0A2K9DTI9_9MICO|nr:MULTISPECIES: ROK family protein [Microbacterium]AUG30546.1 sugar kinase [Microbacterium hominis]QOC26308.1 ROK family protein [Microbacterium hominis]QYF97387.1 ROK family protein [Microbacterium sp. PAMC21962]
MRLGFDVGGTKTDAVVVASGGGDRGEHILARLRRPTGWGADAVVATILTMVDELADAVGRPASVFSSIGVGMPGQVAPGGSTVTHAVNLGIDELDLALAIGPRLGIPVRAENDVKAAAVGAYALHGAAGSSAMAYLNLGTGIAAGFVRGGRLWRGVHGSAGEVGHISVDPAGPLCRCGQRGCIEAFSGGAAVAERWARPGALPVRDVFDAADAGDAEAIALRRGLAYGVASAIRVIVLAGDVDAVVLGGGVTALGDRMLRPVLTELEESAAASPFLRSLRLSERVDLLPPGSPAAALGAAIVGADSEQEAVFHG